MRTTSRLGNYSGLLSVTWYTTPGLYRNHTLLSQYPDITSKIHLLSLELPQPEGDKFLHLEKEYEKSLHYSTDNVSFGLKEASLYDSVKIVALSVIQSGSIRGTDLQTAIRENAANYSGASGRITLDDNGDRVKTDFEIFGYYHVNGVTKWINMGRFDSETGKSLVTSPQK
jgi:hypothetical protein